MPPKTKTTTPVPPRRIEYMPLGELRTAEHNPKGHDKPRIAGSISRFGFADAAILDERTGRLVAGHGRYGDLVARKEAGKEPPEGVVVDEHGEWLMPIQRGWASRSDEDAEAFLVAHNRLTETGGWDDSGLLEMLERINDADPELLDVTGYSEDDLEELLTGLNDEAGDLAGGEGGGGLEDGHASETGALLDLVDVTVAEPTAQPKHGQVWRLGRHTLVVAKVMTEHHLWRHLLDDDVKLCPYPDPYLTHGTVARENVLLLVQPSTYLAGHTVDKFAAAFPAEAITCDGTPYVGGQA